MKKFILPAVALLAAQCSPVASHKPFRELSENLIDAQSDSVIKDSIIYHPVRVDQNGHILPWYAANLGRSYDHVLSLVWNFWKNMETDSNGQKYYMNHQVWRPNHDRRGLGGDQFMMALSSWDLYYNYTGDSSVLQNMLYIADYYLSHALSPESSQWPNLPFPYNTRVESGIFDGDMILGKDYLQPDKAGSFGFELVKLYKKTGQEKYLDAAVRIANTLAAKVQPGDSTHSPWPFKVNAITGKPGVIVLDQVVWYEGMDKDVAKNRKRTMESIYTSNWTPTLELFSQLVRLRTGDTSQYKKAFDLALGWMKAYPAKTNKWGPFFEDVPRWSDTQINAITYAMYLLEHPELDPEWKQNVNKILQWVKTELGDKEFAKYGVTTIDEQTAYRVPGNSHSSRQASVELMYWEKTGDTTYVRNAIRELSWATYMVDNDGKNFYPTNDIWMTDGYGDYVRHYLRAMAAAPQLAPDNANHLLHSSSVVKHIAYSPAGITYTTFDHASRETFRLLSRPDRIEVNGNKLSEAGDPDQEGWIWESLNEGGILKINKSGGDTVTITW
jgi:hypothetical protein